MPYKYRHKNSPKNTSKPNSTLNGLYTMIKWDLTKWNARVAQHKKINVICHIHRMRGKKYSICISIDAEKAVEKLNALS